MWVGKTRSHDIDLMVAARPGIRLGRVSLYLLLGGGLNVLLDASQVNSSGGGEDLNDDLRKYDLALLAGVGGALHLPRGPARLGTVFLEARHDRGLLDTDLTNGGFKNRTSSLMLGLSFALTSPR
jgi:opacity protein-like surface antigen